MWRSASNASVKLKNGSQRFEFAKIRSSGRKYSTESTNPTNPPTPPKPPILGPPPPTPKKSVLPKVIGLTTLTVGGVVGYAWYDPSFRKTVEDNVPYSKEAFDAIFKALPNSVPEPAKKKESLPEQIIPPVKLDKKPTKSQQQPKKEEVTPKADAVTESKSAKPENKPVDDMEQRMKQRESQEAADNAALEIILENLTDACNKVVKETLDVQNKVRETTKTHYEALKKAMDDTSEILNKDLQWKDVTEAFKAKQDSVTSSQTLVEQARENLEKLKNAIEEGKSNIVTKKNKAIYEAQNTLNKLKNELSKSETAVMKSESQFKTTMIFKDLVEKGIKQFRQELESIMPDVKIGHGKKLTQDELNSLIAHAHRRIEQLQKQLAEQIAFKKQFIQDAMDKQQQEDEKIADQRLASQERKLRDDFLLEKDKWELEAREQFEKELRHHLARQAAAHSDHLRDILKVQEKELEEAYERELNTRLIEERQSFHTEVANWIARLKGIEQAVEGRAEAEKMSRKAQQLWLACVALNGALLHGIEDIEIWEFKIKPLANEIAAVSDAAGNHPYVQAILKTIPEISYERGVWTNDSLTERFDKVRRVCKRVAMIDETGGSLFKYFVSYIQSFFIFETVYAKQEGDELESDNFNTYSVLAHAKYWMDKGDLEMAVRFMNQLTGEARVVAEDWLKEAKLHLETRQATQALMAFASASGLGTIF